MYLVIKSYVFIGKCYYFHYLCNAKRTHISMIFTDYVTFPV